MSSSRGPADRWLAWSHISGRARSEAAARHAHAANDVYVSAATAWEVAIKAGLGKLSGEQLTTNSLTPLPISVRHVLAVHHLPDHHRDRFDRLLVAQAQIEQLTLVTADERISQYDVAVLVADAEA